jgi:hypothetical protein
MQAELHPPVRGAFDAKKANQNGSRVGKHQQVHRFSSRSRMQGTSSLSFWQMH